MPSGHSQVHNIPRDNDHRQLLDVQQQLLDSLAENITLVSLVSLVPGLLNTLMESAGSITVLAPTEAAFHKLPVPLVEYLTNPKNVDVLAKVLKYHVIKNDSNLLGEVYPSKISINSVLVPPTLTDAVASIVNSAPPVHHSVPLWMMNKNPGNNRA